MATLKETLDRFLGPSKGAGGQATGDSPYGLGPSEPGVDLGPGRRHADFVAAWALDKAAHEGTETLAQFEARTGMKYARSPYGIPASSRFY